MKKNLRKILCLSLYFPGILLAVFLLSQPVSAQSPTITNHTGIPTGSADSKGVAYGNNIYVTILGGGKIYTSADGITWNKITDTGIPAGITFTSLAFGSGVFVATGYNGLILSSANGQNWTSRNSGTSNIFWDIKFYQSKFYAVGENATIRSSTDGITWNNINPGTGTSTDVFLSITWGNGLLMISARSTNSGSYSLTYRSATGASNSWTLQDLGIGMLNRVQYLKDKFFAFVAGHQVYTSSNGTSWTDATASISLTLPDASPGTWNLYNQIFNGFYDGTKFYFFGCSEYYSGYGSVWTSTTGTDLTLLTRTAYIVPQGSGFINGKYFEWGNEGLVYSTNGITYKYPSGSYNEVASGGSGYAAVGSIGNSGIIFTSPDFNTWTEKTPVGQKELYSVVYNGSKYVAIGSNTVVQSTDNGNSWQEIATPARTYNSIAWGNSQFVATADGNISYSSDGITWTTGNSDNYYYFKVRYVNGHFFALGYTNADYLGVIMHSTDGISWSNITPSLAFPVYYYNDVVYDGSKFHFMGMDWDDPESWIYGNFFSLSTATVTDPNSFANKGTIALPPVSNLGGYWGEGAFVFSNGHFTGAVNDINSSDTYVIYSNDGITWTAEAINERTNIYGAIAEGNTARLIGTGDGKITVDFGGITLPVTLSYFKALSSNGQSLLKWQTAGEQNSDHFTVQHSSDAGNWQTIGTVAAAGQSQTTKNYQFIHTTPAKGFNYYRVVQADIDGREKTSHVEHVYFGKTKTMVLYPNPALEWVQLELPGQGNATVTLFNAGGQPVYTKIHSENSIRVSLQQLPKGIYRVVVNQDGENYVQTVLHQ